MMMTIWIGTCMAGVHYFLRAKAATAFSAS